MKRVNQPINSIVNVSISPLTEIHLMKLDTALNIACIDKVTIHSIESNLYQVSINYNNEEHYLTNNDGELLQSRNKLYLQTLFFDTNVKSMVLSHISAYDEMIGLPSTNNRLEVPLKKTVI